MLRSAGVEQPLNCQQALGCAIMRPAPLAKRPADLSERVITYRAADHKTKCHPDQNVDGCHSGEGTDDGNVGVSGFDTLSSFVHVKGLGKLNLREMTTTRQAAFKCVSRRLSLLKPDQSPNKSSKFSKSTVYETNLDSVEGGDTESSEREEYQDGDVDEEVGAAVQALERFSQFSQNVLSGHNDLRVNDCLSVYIEFKLRAFQIHQTTNLR